MVLSAAKPVFTIEEISQSAGETVSLGMRFAAEHLAFGSVVLLHGELGAGKTQFAKGIATAFGINEDDISSPTFSLVNEYDIISNGLAGKLNHLDCYRFEKPEELLELGVEDYLYPTVGITIIEWPERIQLYLPEHRFDVLLEELTPETRKITIEKR